MEKIKNLFIKLISFYQNFISINFGYNCRFYPSCSEYALLSVKKYGIFFGLKKGIWRILKCNPLNKGGVDMP